MKALVTGATGFIGGNLVKALLDEGFQVRALVRRESSTFKKEHGGIEPVTGDVRDIEAMRRAVQGCNVVFHVAALYTFWSRDPRLMYETNVQGTLNVLQAALEAGVQRVVYTSTVSTMGVPRQGHLSNEDSHPRSEDLVGPYKRSKYKAEQEALKLFQKGLPVVIVNPSAPVGRGDVKPTPTGRLVLDFVKGRMPAYVETGLNLVDVEDVAQGHILALRRGRPGERYILGNRNLSLKEIFGILADITGRRAPRLRIPYWLALASAHVDDIIEGKMLRREPRIPLEGTKIARHHMYVDCSKAVKELGMPQTPIEQALEKAVRWFKDNGYY